MGVAQHARQHIEIASAVGVNPRSGVAEFATPANRMAERKTCEPATLLLAIDLSSTAPRSRPSPSRADG